MEKMRFFRIKNRIDRGLGSMKSSPAESGGTADWRFSLLFSVVGMPAGLLIWKYRPGATFD